MSATTKIRFAYQRNALRARKATLLLIDWLALILRGPIRTDLSADSGRPVILFLGEYLQGRIPRMAKWIQRSGQYDCVLLVKEGKDYSILEQRAFRRIITFRSGPHLKRILKGLEGVFLIHSFTLPSYQTKLAIDVAGVPVVMDAKDMYVSYFGLDSPKLYMRVDMPHEEASIREADGIVAQSMELFAACKSYGIKRRPPTLFFPVYCDDDNLVDTGGSKEDGIHVVYAGAVAGSFQDDEHFGSMKLFWLIDALSRQQIHLHVYPSPAIRFGDLVLGEYAGVDADNQYFHLHQSVPLAELPAEMSKYHFGTLPFYLEDTGRSATKLGRGSSLKIFNYLEAGIPVLVSEDLRFQSWLTARYGAAIPMRKADFSQLREMLRTIDHAEMRQNITSMRRRLTLGENVGRLINFYEVVAGRGDRVHK